MGDSTSLAKWSSLELLAEEDDSPPALHNKGVLSSTSVFPNEMINEIFTLFCLQTTVFSATHFCSELLPSVVQDVQRWVQHLALIVAIKTLRPDLQVFHRARLQY